ncbi:MAG: ComEC/Rec2 family competence protein [Oligoflexales bacterium]
MFAAWLSGFFYGQWSTLSQPCFFHFLILIVIILSLREKKQQILITLGFLNGFSMSYPWAKAAKSKCITHLAGAAIFQQKQAQVIAFGKGDIEKKNKIFYSNSIYAAPRSYSSSLAMKPSLSVLKQWEAALLQGDISALDSTLKKHFQQSGLIHLLCVSGFHIQMIFQFILLIIRQPLKILTRLNMRPQYIEIIYLSAPWIGLVIITLYSLSIGFPPSTQRATLVCITQHVFRHLSQNHFIIPQIAATFQSLLFPYHMLSPSNLLSWGAYLIIRHKAQGNRFKNLLLQNLYLALLSLIFIDQFPLHAPIVNFLALPFFPFVYLATITNCIIPNNVSQELILLFFQWISFVSQPIQIYPSLLVTFSSLPCLAQCSLILLFFLIFIKNFLFSTKERTAL